MPFEPRLFSGGDDSPLTPAELPPLMIARGAAAKLLVADELDSDLPDELAALAAQLRDEAATLARQHPPQPVEELIAPAVKSRRRGLWLWPAAAVVIMAAGLLAWRVEHWPARPASQPNVADEQVKSPGAPLTAMAATTMPPTKLHQPADPDLERIRPEQGIAEVGIADTQAPTHGTTDELSMLRRQVDGFEKLIHRFQAELVARDAAEAENQRKIEGLQQENELLRRQLREAQAKP